MCEAILIRCDLYHGSGAGHLKRCLVLSEALKDQGFTPIMVLDRDSGPLPFEVNVIVERISTHSYDQPTDVPVLAKLAVHYGARKVVVDSYRFFRSWVRELQAEGLSVILIDDLHIGADADLAIDYSPAALLSGPNSLNRLCGPSYFITDSNIIAYSKGTPRKMVLHAGGTGGFEAAPCVYAAAIRMLVSMA